MKIRRLIALVLAAVISLSLLAGCAMGGSKEKKTLEIFVYLNDHESQIYKDMIYRFAEEHSDEMDELKIQITTLDEYNITLNGMMLADDMPDVFYVGPEYVEQFVENGYIENLTPWLDKMGISTDGLMQDVIDCYRYDGENVGTGDLYALPKDASVFAYAYNKELFDEAGLPYPDPDDPYTYDEFVEVCKALTKDTDGDGAIDQWGCGFANAYMLHQFIWSNGASFTSEDYRTITIDTPEFKEALQKYVDLTLVHQVTPTVAQDASLGVYQRWLAGQEAFYACGTWDVAAFMDPETFPFEWDLCAYPTLSSGVSYTWLGTVGYCVHSGSDCKELAVELVNYLSTDPEGQREVSGITTGNSIQVPNIIDMAQGEFVQAVENGTVNYPSNVQVIFNYMNGSSKYSGRFMETSHTPNAEWSNIFFESVDMVKNGSMTVDAFVDQIAPEMQAALDEAWESLE